MGTYSGAFVASRASQAPMPSNPAPAKRHGEMKRPDDAWSTPPATTGSGYASAEEVIPQMNAVGIMMDFGHQWGHAATPKIRRARKARFVDRLLGRDTDAQKIIESRAQKYSALAHGDKTAAYYPDHVYSPAPGKFDGESYSRDYVEYAGDAVAMSGRVITKTNKGYFSDGPLECMYKPTGFRRGNDRRWAVALYSSPTLGAMYSKNTLRGILPQTIAIPTNQPASGPWNPSVSGMASQQRGPFVNFLTPSLFRSPPSESDTMLAAKSIMGSTIGLGF